MLHELLLALLGYTGDLVIDERDGRSDAISDFPNEPTFKLAPDLSFIQPSERDVIERLLPLGFYYRELDHFAAKHRHLSSSQAQASESQKKSSGKGSFYRRAIANGIVEILSVYRSSVLQVEQNLLSDPMPILATVTLGLNKVTTSTRFLRYDMSPLLSQSQSRITVPRIQGIYDVLMPPIYELIAEIEREDIKGGQILNLLHKRCHCGVPELQACIQRLLWHGHQVLYNQLASWMVYGILQDPHGEFFIRRQDASDIESESSLSDATEKLRYKSSENAALTDWNVGFHIFLEMLPEHIHMHIAESILFAGKAVRVLRNPVYSFRVQESIHQQHILRGTQWTQGSMGTSVLPKDPLKGANVFAEELFPQSEADKIEEMLQGLKVVSRI